MHAQLSGGSDKALAGSERSIGESRNQGLRKVELRPSYRAHSSWSSKTVHSKKKHRRMSRWAACRFATATGVKWSISS